MSFRVELYGNILRAGDSLRNLLSAPVSAGNSAESAGKKCMFTSKPDATILAHALP